MQPLPCGLGELAVHGQNDEVTPERAEVDGDSLQRSAPAVLWPKVYRVGGHALRSRALSRPNPDQHR